MKRITSSFMILLSMLALSSPSFAADGGDQPAYGFKFSGYFKADIAYDDARISTGNFALKVLPEPKNDFTSITARETRFAFDFWWLDEEKSIKTDAKLEIDFQGLGAEPASYNSMENKAAPMLRHAYLRIKNDRWAVLAGQTSDVISPLVPKTVNYTVCWAIGNIGYRRPQFRLSGNTGITENANLTADVAVTRTLGADNDLDRYGTRIGDGIDDGADAVIPTIQGRIGCDYRWDDFGFIAIGVSGHWGREEFTNEDYQEVTRESWSVNGDLRLTLSERLSLAGEFFFGQDLGTYFGGAMQGINPHTLEEITSQGGWGMLSVTPGEGHTLNFGYGLDNPKNKDVVRPDLFIGDPPVSKNTIIFGNWMYSLTDNITAMLELSQITTSYLEEIILEDEPFLAENDFEDFRLQFALKAAIR